MLATLPTSVRCCYECVALMEESCRLMSDVKTEFELVVLPAISMVASTERGYLEHDL